MNLAASEGIKAVKDKINVDIYFNPEIAESEILSAQVFLENIPEVKEVKYVSKEKAMEDFKADHADDQTIQESLTDLTDNPLPASLVVKADNLEDYQNIITQFESSEFNKYAQNKNFSDHKYIIDRLSSVTKKIYMIGLVVSIIFIIFSIVMVFNTIRIAIYSHREELSIMRLVGATNWFIRAPFFLEAILYALVASIISMTLLYPLVMMVSPFINHLFEGYDFDAIYYFQHYLWEIFALQLFTSLILSAGSSMLAIGRYLKE
jgi:cell division transport system permease protein